MAMSMQLVTRQQLKALANANDGIVESEGAISYAEFLALTSKLLEENFTDEAYRIVRDGWVREHCPPIKYIGIGSGRLALAIDGGKCLKIALDDDGLKQMKNEVQTLIAGDGLYCFPKLYAYDKTNYFSLVVDCCAESKQEDFYKAYGLPCYLAVGTIFELVQQDLDFKRVEKYFRECIADPQLGAEDEYENFEQRLSFLMKLRKHQQDMPQWKVMIDLARFCASNEMLGLYDLESTANWGLATRDGVEFPIVIDAGLDQRF